MPVYLQDAFTDADGTALTSHTMNVGGGWTAVNGTLKILSNKATPNSDADDDMAVSNAGIANVTLTCDITPQRQFAIWEDDPDIVLRYSDSTHLWVVHFVAAPSGGTTVTLNFNNGSAANTYTQVANAAPNMNAGTTYSIRCECQGAVISVYVSEVLAIQYTSATFNQTATKFGLRLGHAGTVTTKCTWDNFLVQAGAGIIMPEVRSGPPMKGAPWKPRLQVEMPPLGVSSVTTAQRQGPVMPEVKVGPMRFGPYGKAWVVEGLGLTPPPEPPITLIANAPELMRVPDLTDKRRLGRFTEIVSSIVNSLIGQGYLVRTGPTSWTLNSAMTAAEIEAAFTPQGAHVFFAGPGPTFRAITAEDLPATVGGVSSVGITGPFFIAWANSPVTGAGVLTGTLIDQPPNTFLRGPTSGLPAAPFFGAIDPADFAANQAALRTGLGFGEYVRAFSAVSVTMSNAVQTYIPFNTNLEDSSSFHSTTVNTTRLTVPSGKAGIYLITACIRWSANPAGDRTLVLQVNRGTVIAVQTVPTVTSGANTDQFITAPPTRLAVGDFVEAYGNQSSGATLTLESQGTAAPFAPVFGMVRVST